MKALAASSVCVLLSLILIEGSFHAPENSANRLREAVLHRNRKEEKMLLDSGVPYDAVDNAGNSVLKHIPRAMKCVFVFYFRSKMLRDQARLASERASECVDASTTPTLEEVISSVSEGRVADLKCMIARGAQTDGGSTAMTTTALHVAVQTEGYGVMAELLLDAGANPYRYDEDLKQPDFYIKEGLADNKKRMEDKIKEIYLLTRLQFAKMRINNKLVSLSDAISMAHSDFNDLYDVNCIMESEFQRTHLQNSSSRNFEIFLSELQLVPNLSQIPTNAKYVIAAYMKSAHSANKARDNGITFEESEQLFESVMAAIRAGDLDALQFLMNKKAPVDPVRPFTTSPLHIAIRQPKRDAIIEILLKAEPNIYRSDENGLPIVEAFNEYKILSTGTLITHLWYEIQRKLEVVFIGKIEKNTLFSKIKTTSTRTTVYRDSHTTPRPADALEGYNTITQYHETNQKVMNDLIHKKDLAKVEDLLKAGVQINPVKHVHYHSALVKAILEENVEMVKLILRYAKPDDNVANCPDPPTGFLPMRFAITKNNPNIVQLLLNYNADTSPGPNQGGKSMALVAKDEEKWAASQVLRKHLKLTPLYAEILDAVKNTVDPSVLEDLLRRGGPANKKEGIKAKQNTPLHLAVKSGSVKKVKLLLTYGADNNVRDKQGFRPLELASGELMKNAFSSSITTLKPIIASTPHYENLSCIGVLDHTHPSTALTTLNLDSSDDKVIDETAPISGNPRRCSKKKKSKK